MGSELNELGKSPQWIILGIQELRGQQYRIYLDYICIVLCLSLLVPGIIEMSQSARTLWKDQDCLWKASPK